jgi:hypothetical protein
LALRSGKNQYCFMKINTGTDKTELHKIIKQ